MTVDINRNIYLLLLLSSSSITKKVEIEFLVFFNISLYHKTIEEVLTNRLSFKFLAYPVSLEIVFIFMFKRSRHTIKC